MGFRVSANEVAKTEGKRFTNDRGQAARKAWETRRMREQTPSDIKEYVNRSKDLKFKVGSTEIVIGTNVKKVAVSKNSISIEF
jgi:hypothetical protein